MMIDLTVKTLDSQNHPFHVEEDITIRQFKEKISDSLNIPPDSQRLIFCGRVLQDDKRLSEYALASGNAIHLVQRPPPSQTGTSGTGARSTGTGTSAGSRSANGMRRSHTFRMRPSNTDRNAGSGRLSRASSWLCASRLNLARRMLRRAGALLTALEDPRAASPPRDMHSPPATVHVTQAVEVLEVGIAHVGDVGQGGHVAVPNITIIRDASDPTIADETVIHIGTTSQQMDSQDERETPAEPQAAAAAQSDSATATESESGTTHLGSGHSTDSLDSTDSFSSATEMPVGGSSQQQQQQASQQSSSANAETPPPTSGSTSGGGRPIHPNNRPNTPLAPLSVVLDELNEVQTRLQPFLAQYHQILQNDPTYPDHETAANAQRMFNRVSQIMHLLSHAYHIISDLMVDLHQNTPRFLTCRPVLMQRSVVGRAGLPTIVTESFANEVNNITVQATRNANGPVNVPTSAPSTPASGAATETQNNARPNPEITADFGNSANFAFMLPDGIATGNVEFVMEVPPRFSRTTTTNANTSESGQTPPATVTITRSNSSFQDQNHHGVISQIVQAVAGQIINRMQGTSATVNVSVSTGTSSAPNAQTNNNTAQQPGQNSQARVNTATHPTTSTQTRSTARPHVQLRQNGLRLPFGGIWGGMTNNFDPYLPCNSHHLRPRSQSNNNNNNSTATNNENNNAAPIIIPQDVSAAAAALEDPDLMDAVNVAAHTVASSIATAAASATVVHESTADLLRTLLGSRTVIDDLRNASTPSGNLILDFATEVIQRIPLNEIISMLSGNETSAGLNELRQIIRRFLLTHLAPGRESLSQEDLRDAGNRAADWLHIHLSTLSTIPTRDNIDLSATLCAIVRARLPDLLSVAMGQEANGGSGESDYGRHLTVEVRQFIDLIVAAIMHSCQEGVAGAEDVFRRFVNSLARGTDPNLLMLALSYSLSEYRNYMMTVVINPDIIQPYLVYKSQNGGASQSMEVEDIDNTQQRSSSLSSQPSSSSSSSGITINTESTTQSNSSSRNETLNNNDRDSNQSMDSLNGTRQVPPLPDIEMDADTAEPVAADVVIGSQTWHNSLPADWVPIISRDVLRQRRQNTQSPLSDAYLQGMPSKRRKLITAERPSLNLTQSLQDTMRQTLQSSNQQPTTTVPINDIVSQSAEDANLLEAYRQQIRGCIRARLQQDPDYNPALYPNSQQKFK